MDSATRVLYWLLDATKGGPTRARILGKLGREPMNMRKLALALKLDYKTVQGHVELMLKNGILDVQGKGYGSVYFISSEFEENKYLKKVLRG